LRFLRASFFSRRPYFFNLGKVRKKLTVTGCGAVVRAVDAIWTEKIYLFCAWAAQAFRPMAKTAFQRRILSET